MHTYHNIINKILNYYISNKIEEEWNKYYLCSFWHKFSEESKKVLKFEKGMIPHRNYYDKKVYDPPIWMIPAEIYPDPCIYFGRKEIRFGIIDRQKFIPKYNVKISNKYITQCIDEEFDNYYYYEWKYGHGIININAPNIRERIYEKDNDYKRFADHYIENDSDSDDEIDKSPRDKFVGLTFMPLRKKIELSEMI